MTRIRYAPTSASICDLACFWDRVAVLFHHFKMPRDRFANIPQHFFDRVPRAYAAGKIGDVGRQVVRSFFDNDNVLSFAVLALPSPACLRTLSAEFSDAGCRSCYRAKVIVSRL